MQFIEKNSFSVRSAVYHLKSDDAGLEFLLFPMIHIGSNEFYKEISQRLIACDLILTEGVDSKKANILTLSYRIVKKIRRMDLVTQQEAMCVSSLSDRIINPDMKAHAFDARWSALPWSLRAQMCVFVPVYAAYLLFFGTRETLAASIALDDLPSSDEVLLQDEHFDKLDSLLIDERDRELIRCIQILWDSDRQNRKLVGVVYGARHMRNLMRFLLGHLHYRVTKAEWVTVFDL